MIYDNDIICAYLLNVLSLACDHLTPACYCLPPDNLTHAPT